VTVTHRDHRGRVRLPADYVADSLELGYASTAHRVQGMTVDTAHALITPDMTREALYVASTRGRNATHWYATTEHVIDATSHHEPEQATTARALLTGVLTRRGGEDSASSTIRTTQDEARSLPTLVARYVHAWTHGALDALRTTAETALSPAQVSRLLNDPGAGQLARSLADATSRGANPTDVLTAAIDYDTLTGVRSTALVLATRIQDYPTTLGIPRNEPADRPLPWLPAPNTGHPAWDDYLDLRARLITDRAAELGTLAESYREQYRLTHLPPGDIGAVPADDGQQRTAHQVVLQALGGDQSHALFTPPASRTQPSRAATAPRPNLPTNSWTTPTRTS
jgi:hypothetical protein